jgi:perosamine synthetase
MYIPGLPSLNPAQFLTNRAMQSLPFPLKSPSKTYFYVARNGIYHLMRSLQSSGDEIVLAPDYHHGNEIAAMKAAGMKIRYYPVKKNLDADLDAIAALCDIEPKAGILYVTHFMGWPQPMNEIKALCRDKNLVLVEDCALSFMSEFEGKPLGTFGAYAVFCLYKSLPLPNGAVLVANTSTRAACLPVQRCSASSVMASTTELTLAWIRSRNEILGGILFGLKRVAGRMLTATRIQRIPIGDTGFDVSAVNVGMSPICHALLARFQYERIKKIRRRNFTILEQRLRGHIALLEKKLGPGVCPLFFPLLVANKQAAAAALARLGIETVEFWNSGDPESFRRESNAEFLRRHVLEIPIHQDVTPETAEYMAQQILKLGVGLAPEESDDFRAN